jgi:hypothetical protein
MNTKLKPGDMLHRSKGIVQHAGVYIGNGMVFHNRPERGAEVTSYSDYAEGKTVKVTCTKRPSLEGLPKRVQETIDTGPSYSVLSNNCEHSANYVISGRKISPQIQSVAICAAIGGVVGKRSGNTAYGCLLGGLAGLALFSLLAKHDYIIESDGVPA